MKHADQRPAWQRTARNRGFLALCVGSAVLSCSTLVVLLYALVSQGLTHLVGLDHDARTEAMAAQEPVEMQEFDDVDWAAAARDLELPRLAALAAVDWTAIKQASGLEFTDEAEDLDWTALAAQYDLDDAAVFAETDWYELAGQLRVPGSSWLAATFAASEAGQFVTSPPSRQAERAGIGPALMGTIWICAICGLFALPIGVGTAIFLEEYQPRQTFFRRLHAFIQLNIANLAGVPSIVYGIIGLTAFVQFFGLGAESTWSLGATENWYHLTLPFGRSAFAGGLTLMLVILPIVIISAQEAIRAVPDSLRQGSLALGATRWQMIRHMTLPASIPGIMTGAILAMSRAIGEAAPVLIICGVVFVRFNPANLMDEFTALPLQIYNWAGRPQESFHEIAASGILVLLAALLLFNALAIFIRQKFQKPIV